MPWIYGALVSCQDEPESASVEDTGPIHVAEVHKNQLTDSVSNLISEQKRSPIHWQPWSKEAFAHASSERKTVFVFFGSGTDADAYDVIEKLNKSSHTCDQLNRNHISIMVDTNQRPDLHYFASMLNLRSGTALSPTLLVWFSYEGNPISWSPVTAKHGSDVQDLVSRMSNTVNNIWENDPDYVLANSREDFQRRVKNIFPLAGEEKEPDSRSLSKSIRQLNSLFDPTSNSIDGINRKHPASYIKCLMSASSGEVASEQQSKTYLKNARSLVDETLLRGLIDPLDGGSFSGQQGRTQDLPVFSKTLRDQAQTMIVLYRMYSRTQDPSYLAAAHGVRGYVEKHLVLQDGGYCEGAVNSSSNIQKNTCVWSLEEIQTALTAEELKVVKIAFGIRGLGNIPLVDDRKRTFFRKNSLTWKVNHKELAERISMDKEQCDLLLKSALKKLAKIRTERSPQSKLETLTTANSLAQLSRAYAQAYRSTGDTKFLDKAVSILVFIKTKMTSLDGTLHHSRFNGKLSAQKALAADCMQVCAAALDIYECSMEPAWLQYATSLEKFTMANYTHRETGLLEESADQVGIVALTTIQYLDILLEGSSNTQALAIDNCHRLAAHGVGGGVGDRAKTYDDAIRKISLSLPLSGVDYLSTRLKLRRKKVYIAASSEHPMLNAALAQRCHIIPVQKETTYPGLKDVSLLTSGKVIVQDSGGKVLGNAETPEALTLLLSQG